MVRVVAPVQPMPIEDHSASSTYDVTTTASACKSAASVLCSSPLKIDRRPRERRRVYFDAQRDIIHENHVLCKEETATLWYNSNELKVFQDKQSLAVREILKLELEQQNEQNAEKSYTAVLTRVYQDCCRRSRSSNDIRSDDRTSTRDERLLQKWIVVGVSRLGLERAVVRSIRKDKWIRRQELVQAVLECQTYQEDHLLLLEDSEEHIAAVAREISLPSREFASLLAKAQLS